MSLSRLFVITGDASGDVHGAPVIRRLQEMMPGIDIEAIGGDRIAATGVPIFHQQRKMGALGLSVVTSLHSHLFLGQRLLKYLKAWQPDAVLLIDYGMFNLWVAKHLKRMGIKVFYYVPPQVWASKKWRIKAIRERVDHVFCIFPFEKDLYDREGVPATFVGHPLVEQREAPPDPRLFREEYCLDPEMPIVGLFPGSRKAEVSTLLEPMLGALPLIEARAGKPFQFILAPSPAVSTELFEPRLAAFRAAHPDIKLAVVSGRNHDVLALSQAILASSGTITLEAALAYTPSVIAYILPRFVYWVYLIFRYVKHIGLPNLLSDRPEGFLPELMMEHVTAKNLCEAVLPYLDDTETRREALAQFRQIESNLGMLPASRRVVEGLMSQMGCKHPYDPLQSDLH